VRELHLSDIEKKVYQIGNALRRDRSLIYRFDAGTRIWLIPVMRDPKDSYARLERWLKTSEKLGSWAQVQEVAKDHGIDLEEVALNFGWKMSQLEQLYDKVVEMRESMQRNETEARTPAPV
jgi:hypothetical protein